MVSPLYLVSENLANIYFEQMSCFKEPHIKSAYEVMSLQSCSGSEANTYTQVTGTPLWQMLSRAASDQANMVHHHYQ